jgi:hypothetical protein
MVTIPAQFNGPEHSGNGGYVAGLLATEAGPGPVTSTLRIPPPLDTPLSWEHDARSGEVRLLTAGGAVVGSAVPGEFARDVPVAPTAAEAEQALADYLGFADHPFDRCFTCGTARGNGDGLRLFPGPVDEHRTAAPWTPHAAFGGPDGVLDVPTTWAALDCPGGWAADFTRQVMVLGRMTAEVVRPPSAGEPCLATGVLRSRDGRKFITDTALYTADGELLGRAEQIWLEVDPATFR